MTKIRKEDLEKAIRKRDEQILRKRNVGNYLQNFIKGFHRPLLIELARKFKERGEFGVNEFLIADYYTKPEDRMVAVLSGLMISEKGDILRQTAHLRKIITDNPCEWLKRREFVSLGIGRNQDKKLDGGKVRFWQLSQFFDNLWSLYDNGSFFNQNGFGLSLLATMEKRRWNAIDAMTYFFGNDENISSFKWKANLCLIRIFRTDGLGLGILGKGDEKLFCPSDPDVVEFLKMWFPDYRRYGNFDECVSLFSFDDDIDFFYAYMGWKELGRRNPGKCSRYASRYLDWYTTGRYVRNIIWKQFLPTIEF